MLFEHKIERLLRAKPAHCPSLKYAREGFAAVKICYMVVGVVVWSLLHNYCVSFFYSGGNANAFPTLLLTLFPACKQSFCRALARHIYFLSFLFYLSFSFSLFTKQSFYETLKFVVVPTN